MIASHGFKSFTAFLALVTISIFLSMNCGDVAYANIGLFNSSIAGTYLANDVDGGKIMQISADGNISLIFSDQFIGKGTQGEYYSNGLGSWKWIGLRKIAAEVVDVSYYSGDPGEFAGVAAYKAIITFSRNLRTAYLTCEGGLYKPGDDPFAPGVQPDSTFDCGEVVYQRVRP